MRVTKSVIRAAAACALIADATASAMAASTAFPGETAGGAQGAPVPPGFYFIDETNWGQRDTTGGGKTAIGVSAGILMWSTPWTLAGARLEIFAALPLVEVGHSGPPGSAYFNGLMDPALAAALAWNLGNGFNFSYTLFGDLPVTDPVSDPAGAIEHRFALTYLRDGWNLTGNFIYGMHTVNETLTGHPDFFNVDMTAAKALGKWEVGAIGYYSTDLQSEALAPGAPLLKQSQFALGALVGYDWGQFRTQVYVSHDVYQQNYQGYDTRVWGRFILPLGDPLKSVASSDGLLYRK